MIDDNSEIFPFVSIGSAPPRFKNTKGESTSIKIGKNCKIREYVATVNLGTSGGGEFKTDNCLY